MKEVPFQALIIMIKLAILNHFGTKWRVKQRLLNKNDFLQSFKNKTQQLNKRLSNQESQKK
jgi:hypothetical protein